MPQKIRGGGDVANVAKKFEPTSNEIHRVHSCTVNNIKRSNI